MLPAIASTPTTAVTRTPFEPPLLGGGLEIIGPVTARSPGETGTRMLPEPLRLANGTSTACALAGSGVEDSERGPEPESAGGRYSPVASPLNCCASPLGPRRFSAASTSSIELKRCSLLFA